jgi:hypothetical protein
MHFVMVAHMGLSKKTEELMSLSISPALKRLLK